MKDNSAKKNINNKSRSKNITFWIILILIPVILISLLEIGLGIFDYGDDLSLFKQGEGQYENYMYINRWVAGRYFDNEKLIPDPPNDVFLKDKPENCYRIFVLGGSTAAGWPYPNNLMFSRILNKSLTNTFPDKHIEIVNTSISAINTYTQLDFLEEILDQQPDAVLLYSGHNEYYGAFGVASTQSIGKARWLKKLYLNLVHYKTFQLVRNFIRFSSGIFADDSASQSGPGETLMERLVSEQKIVYGSELYTDGVDQYRKNLTEIIETLKEEGVPLIISNLVSNLKDQPPFLSESGEGSAETFFKSAKEFEGLLKLDQAKEAYIKAKDYDLLRFRASEDINLIIDELAEKYDIPVVQMTKYFEDASFNSIVGNDLILDHLHPNVIGYFLMAEAFYNKMKEEKLISDSWPENVLLSRSEMISNWGMTRFDIVFASLRLAYLKGGWPFKPAGTQNTAIKDFVFKDEKERRALAVWQDRDYTSEDAHADIAAVFESDNDFESAFNEYNALTCLKPYNYSAYLKAAEMLIHMNRKPEALPYLQQSLKLNKTAYAYQWIGIILFEQSEFNKAVSYLQEVYNLDIKEPVLLYTLGSAYVEINKPDLAELMAAELQPLAANSESVTQMYLKLNSKIKNISEKK